ncbi:PREDICTED: zinc finger CCHC domain-containing protein 8 homolog [Nicrophorus vespilloides]|uniref:Zinc finger CCHC domain-containing protein 8 homolog n=1 Tax=Nicrophorus vespilloides TaxID=110193 RepID=A0ABM1MUR7_NICVS|nr:PREDICTED: zinc finger CCHC domain-containing protein 8 homolog [Nicrophorus vespilloides]
MDELSKGKKRKSCQGIIELSDDEKSAQLSRKNDNEEPVKKCPKISNLASGADDGLIDLVSEASNENGSNDSSVQVIEPNVSVIEIHDSIVEGDSIESVEMCVVDSTSLNTTAVKECKDDQNIVRDSPHESTGGNAVQSIQLSDDSAKPADSSSLDSTPKKKSSKKKSRNCSDFIATKASTFKGMNEDADGSLIVIDKVGDCQTDEECELADPDGEEPTSNSPLITITFKNSNIKSRYKYKFTKFLAKFKELKAVESKHTIQMVAKRDSLFVLDTQPSDHGENNTMYTTKYEVTGAQKEKKEDDKVKFVQTCFNCDGSHSLKDCPEPKDFHKINQARRLFKQNNNGQSNVRYHVEENAEYSHLVPGKVSDKLRNALGLGSDEIPAHVYKMRLMGYPPGWLQEAKVAASNMNIYLDVSKIGKKKKQKQETIDPEKVVDYPGFNVPTKQGIFDHYNKYRVPAFSEMCNKNKMIDWFNNKAIDEAEDQQSSDMDLDADASQEAASEDSTSLLDLNLQKEQLLTQLSESGEIIDESEQKDEDNNEDASKDTSLSVVEDEATNSVKASIFGTPILKSASAFSRLPCSENFSKEMSPVINFENLPNSTGKYEQMTGVLNKIRKTLKSGQDKT